MSNQRRSAGEGSISEYQVKKKAHAKDNGKRYLIKIRVTDSEGISRQVLRRGFTDKKDAQRALLELRNWSNDPKRATHDAAALTTGDYLDDWLDGLQLAPQTLSSYRRLVRLHMKPYLGQIRLQQLTGPKITAMYRTLERGGKADGSGNGLSAKTVRYVANVLHRALKDAERARLISGNPCDLAEPPSARAAASPEMVTWDAAQVRSFMDWAKDDGLEDHLRLIYQLGFATGARRGELLSLRWSDIDFDNSAVSIRRSVGSIRHHGGSIELVEGPTKSGKPRPIAIDSATLESLRDYKRQRAVLAFRLATGDAKVFGNIEGGFLLPDSVSGAFLGAQVRFGKWRAQRVADGIQEVAESHPRIRFHDIRHTHATILLRAGVHPKVMQERLGHSNITTTMETYSHVLPSMQKEAAEAIALALYR